MRKLLLFVLSLLSFAHSQHLKTKKYLIVKEGPKDTTILSITLMHILSQSNNICVSPTNENVHVNINCVHSYDILIKLCKVFF
jgi:hypothetical protein